MMKNSTRLALLGLALAMPMMSSAADTLLPKVKATVSDKYVSEYVKLYDHIQIENGVLTSKSKTLCDPTSFDATMNESNVITIRIKKPSITACGALGRSNQDLTDPQALEFSIDLKEKLREYYRISKYTISNYQFKVGNTMTFEN